VVMTTSFYFDAANDYKVFVFLRNADGTLAPPVKYATASTYGCMAKRFPLAMSTTTGATM